MTGRTVLRRTGSAAIVVGLVGLGLAAGLAFGAPAHADSGSIEIKMPGQTGFSSISTRPLLSVDDLVPGGSTTGSMQVRDNSGTRAGSGFEDSLLLTMVNVQTGAACLTGPAFCADSSGASLADAMEFSLLVTDSASGSTLLDSSETLDGMQDGVLLATGLAGGDTIAVQLTASLPESIGNGVQYGTLGFNVELGLITVGGASSATSSSASSGGAASSGSSGTSGSATSSTTHGTPGETVIIGGGSGSLSYTGVPVAVILFSATGLLVVGVLLPLAGRARSPRRESL